jgi:hypothetical protein
MGYPYSTQGYKSIFKLGLLLLPGLVCALSIPGSAQTLVVNRVSVTGSGSIGTTFGMDQTVSITSSNATQINFTVTTQTSNKIGGDWLTVSVGGAAQSSVNGTTPATLTIFANMQGFAPGRNPGVDDYKGTVTITPRAPSTGASKTISVSVIAFGVDSLGVTWAPVVGTIQNMPLTTSPGGNTGKVVVSSADTTLPLFFAANATVVSPAGGNWLQISQSAPKTTAMVGVSVQTSGLTVGSYTGRIDFTDTDNIVEFTLPVTLKVTTPQLVTSPSSLTLSVPAGSMSSLQTINLTSGDPNTPIVLQNVTDDGVAWATVTLAATPSAGGTFTTPGSLSILLDATKLISGQQYTDTVRVFANASNSPLTFNITLNITAPPIQTISHIADGGGWKTTIVLVNLDTQPAQYTVNFWNESGFAIALPLVSGSNVGTIQPGGSQTIETAGTGANTLVGWAEVVSGQKIGGTAIFRDVVHTQEAAVPLLSAGGSKLFLPFDSHFGFGVAMANSSTSADAQITMTMRDEQGNAIPMTIDGSTAITSLSLARHSHRQFGPTPLNATTGIRGVIEFDSPNVPIFALGIRAVNNQAFTSIDAVTPQPPATKTISHIADGGGWKTTIILVNTDTKPAQYSVNFWDQSGAALAIPLVSGFPSGTIPPGSSQTIETAGTGTNTLVGWAEVLSSQQIGGTAIFRDVTNTQEAAVPLLAAGGSKLYLPFDSHFGFGVAMANSNVTTDAQVTMIMRDEQGNVIPMTFDGSTAITSLALARHSHQQFGPRPLNATTGIRGVIEFDSPSVPIFGLGIRAVNNQAFTSIRALNP